MRPSVLGLIFERDISGTNKAFTFACKHLCCAKGKNLSFLWLVSKVNSESKKGLYA